MKITREWLLPVVAAAILAIGFVLPGQDADTRPPRTVKVTQASFACATNNDTSVAVGRYAAHTGAKTTTKSLPAGLEVPDLGSSNRWAEAKVDGDALVVAASDEQGAGAVGFAAEEPPTKQGGGLSVDQCPGVVEDGWFLGAGSGSKHFTTLTLTNLTDASAIADITLWGKNGPIDAVDSQGIVLRGFQTKTIKLETLAAGEPELAVHVHSRRGAMSIAARDTSTAVFAGTEAIPATSAPTKSQLIPGLESKTRSKQLLLLNPGDTTARVKVEALGKDGSLVPTGLDDVKVSAGRIKVLDVPKSAGDGVLGLRLTSDFPLSAGVRMAATAKDYAYAVGGPILDGPAIAPLSIDGKLKDAKLVMTAPGKASTVTVTAYDKDMKKVGATNLALKAASTDSIDLGKKGLFDVAQDKIAYVVVTSVGDVAGSAVYGNGDGLSAIPLRAVPLRTEAPDVRPGH